MCIIQCKLKEIEPLLAPFGGLYGLKQLSLAQLLLSPNIKLR